MAGDENLDFVNVLRADALAAVHGAGREEGFQEGIPLLSHPVHAQRAEAPTPLRSLRPTSALPAQSHTSQMSKMSKG